MKKNIILFVYIFTVAFSISSSPITKNYIQVYGEAPRGRIPINLDSKSYSMQDTVLLARAEAMEFLDGMIYGYDFVYTVENPLLNTQSYFDISHIARIRADDPNLTLTQLEEATSFMRVQAQYRLNDDQKQFINGFRMQAGQMTMGDGYAEWTEEWGDRVTGAFKNAIQNAVLNAARRQYQSRPQYISGRIILRESPRIRIDAGKWHCTVKADLVIDNVSYREHY